MRVLKSVFLTCLALSLFAGCGPQAASDATAAAAPEEVSTVTEPETAPAMNDNLPEFKGVDLVYVDGDDCVDGEDEVFVFKNKKPKKVKFWAHPAKTYYWEIEYDAGKPKATGDYFGQVDSIGCNDNHTATANHSESPAEKVPDDPDDEEIYYWPYSITVYACEDGNKAEKPLCTKDPRIGIRP